MDKPELIITTAKELFLKMYGYPITETSIEKDLSRIDKAFKSIVKTISESYLESQKVK